MSDPGCLVIDDVDSALALATDLGRSILAPAAERVRAAVLGYFARRGWATVQHSAYVKWANGVRLRGQETWFVLDPLFPAPHFDPNFRPLRISRDIDLRFGKTIQPSGHGAEMGEAGIIDDAASSGRTVRYVATQLLSGIARVSAVTVCASSRVARDVVRASNREIRWSAFVPGDWRAIHLRDGCPHLPFSGRPLDARDPLTLALAPVGGRVLATETPGSLWQVLWLDSSIRRAIVEARCSVARSLAALLGRPALIRDLNLLGGSVAAVVRPGERVTLDSEMETLAAAFAGFAGT